MFSSRGRRYCLDLQIKKGDAMNGRWRRYAIIGVLVFDLCLVAVRNGPLFDQGKNVSAWAEGLPVHNPHLQEVLFDPRAAGTQDAGRLTLTTVILLTAMTLM